MAGVHDGSARKAAHTNTHSWNYWGNKNWKKGETSPVGWRGISGGGGERGRGYERWEEMGREARETVSFDEEPHPGMCRHVSKFSLLKYLIKLRRSVKTFQWQPLSFQTVCGLWNVSPVPVAGHALETFISYLSPISRSKQTVKTVINMASPLSEVHGARGKDVVRLWERCLTAPINQ